jgi:UDP-N-acetylmuramate--alanine ligase
LLDIYPASEKPIEGITAQALGSRIAGAGKTEVRYVPSFPDAIATVVDLAHPGDMILTLGAGSVSQLGAMILEKLEARSRAPDPNQLGTVSIREKQL